MFSRNHRAVINSRSRLSLWIPLGVLLSVSAQAQPMLDHTAIYVKDLSVSAGFYKDVIGLKPIPEPFHDGLHAWFDLGNGAALHIIQGADEKKQYYRNQHTCLRVPSVPAFVEILKKHNVVWEDRDGKAMATTTRVDGVKQLWLKDPDGYWIEINDAGKKD